LRNVLTFRRVVSLVLPGAVLLFIAWALQQEETVKAAALPYAASICFATLGASALLSWYHNYARVLCTSVVVGLSIWTFGRQAPEYDIIRPAIAFLLPLNFALFGLLKERGLATFEGAFKGGIIGMQVLLIQMFGQSAPGKFLAVLQWGRLPSAWIWLPWAALVSFAAVAVFLLVLVCLRRTSVEAGLLWSLAVIFIAMNQGVHPGGVYLYGGAVGLVLTFAVLEHGFDMAYRDELTGLPGRRAFNEVLQQLRRRYTIAMCDVDDFKQFNDTYGHDAGDQILKTVASTLFGVKGGGRAFRYGGEEFALVFNGRSVDEVRPFLEAMRDAIAHMGLQLNDRENPLEMRMRKKGTPAPTATVNITISIGVADNSGDNDRPEVVLEAADAALYRAKESGKNCVRLLEGVSV
jgi:diguanylate cyclase (GGDEF)-like protein